MDFEKLLKKELSNFYACSKQVNEFFHKKELSFLSVNMQETFKEYLNVIITCENFVEELLKERAFNPSNTIDSIIEEITENHKEIILQQIDDEIKSTGYKMSINRLMGYYQANLENIIFLMDEPKVVDELESQLNELSKIKAIMLPISS